MVAKMASNLRCQAADKNYWEASEERDAAHAAWKLTNTEFFAAKKAARKGNA